MSVAARGRGLSSVSRKSSRYKPGDNVRFLALALLLAGLVIGGASETETERSVGDLVGVPVWSIRDVDEHEAHLPLWVRGLADARLVPLAALPLPPSGRGQLAAAEEPALFEPRTPLSPTQPGQRDVSAETSAGVATLLEGAGVINAFFQGYRDAGGQYPEGQIDAMIQCESSWNPLAVSPWGHKGLSQFSDYSWATVAAITEYWDWTDPWQMGYNTAAWMTMTEPAQQWACW